MLVDLPLEDGKAVELQGPLEFHIESVQPVIFSPNSCCLKLRRLLHISSRLGDAAHARSKMLADGKHGVFFLQGRAHPDDELRKAWSCCLTRC